MMLLGVPPQNLVDCTSALPPPVDVFPGANLPLAAGPSAPSGNPGAPPGAPPGFPGPPKGAPSPPAGFPGPPKGERPSGSRGQRPTGRGRDAAVAATSARDNGYIAPTPAAVTLA